MCKFTLIICFLQSFKLINSEAEKNFSINSRNRCAIIFLHLTTRDRFSEAFRLKLKILNSTEKAQSSDNVFPTSTCWTSLPLASLLSDFSLIRYTKIFFFVSYFAGIVSDVVSKLFSIQWFVWFKVIPTCVRTEYHHHLQLFIYCVYAVIMELWVCEF